MNKYTRPDPLHGNGKAFPKPYNPGTSGERILSWQSAVWRNSPPNSRVRMSKKARIVQRDVERFECARASTLKSVKRFRRAFCIYWSKP